MAGQNRLHMTEVVRQPVDTTDMLPAFGQGPLTIECCAGDDHVARLLAPLNHEATEHQMTAERAFLAVPDGSCQTPIAGLSEFAGDRVHLRGEIFRLDGSKLDDATQRGC